MAFINCRNCGEQKKVRPKLVGKQFYCSMKCRDSYIRKHGEYAGFYGKKHTEKTKEKMRMSKKDNPLNSRYWLGKKIPEEIRERMRIGSIGKGKGEKHWNWGGKFFGDAVKLGMKGLIKQQNMKEPTSIEKKLYEELKNRGLLFEIQKLINGKFLVDAYIPSLNLVIEADGDYWHSLDRVVKKDRAENSYLIKCGYKLLRLSEHEINDGSFIKKMEV